MKKILTFLVVLGLASVASAGVTAYSQDFEDMNQADPAVLANDGWLVFGNVWGLDWNYWYGYGAYPAPHGTCGFSSVAAGEGGPGQGAQQLVVYSDYCNDQHGYAWVEANVFREWVIDANDVGSCWTFSFDVKRGDLQPNSFSKAFIKTIDPANNWAMTNFLYVDTTALPTTWSSDLISITIDAGLVDQILQIGFLSTASEWTPSGILYDNINFTPGDVQVDIRPETCPNPLATKGEGILTVAILGDLDLDVTDIDAASVELGGAPVIRSKYQDVGSPVEDDCPDGPDGITDLVLKFDRADIVSGLGAVHHGDEVSLLLTGNLLTGECIAGSDSVVIVGKADPAQRPPKK